MTAFIDPANDQITLLSNDTGRPSRTTVFQAVLSALEPGAGVDMSIDTTHGVITLSVKPSQVNALIGNWLSNLPTTLPPTPGVWWINGGVLQIS